eukprot:scaffold61101_cov44-Phaeocystis_antarctica.AAC.1
MFREAGARFCLRSHQRTKHEKASLVFESHHPEPRTRASKSAGGPESHARALRPIRISGRAGMAMAAR